MRMTKLVFFVLLICPFFCGSLALAQEPNQSCASHCGCGCACDANCKCGCEHHPCNCHLKTKQSPRQIQEANQPASENEGEDNQYLSMEDDGEKCCDGCDREGDETDDYYCSGDGSPLYPWGPIYRCDDECELARLYGMPGTWMPEQPPLFRPFVADPRQVTLSAGWRFNDQALTKNVIDVSYADSFPIYRFCDVPIGPLHGELQFDIEGALWACFDPLTYSSPLINADYYVGVPITYAFGCWSFRLRGFHISSHIGDEFLLNHPGFDRRNPSAEYLDFFVSYEITDEIRIYDGLGVVVSQDNSFKIGRFYAEAGLEMRFRHLGFTDYSSLIYGEPFYGMHFRYRDDFRHHVDQTYVLGYEFGKLNGLRHKARFFFEYHDGYSLEGQFAKFATNYFSIRASYGF